MIDGKEAYPNPKRPMWPIADFIVGNPPFIGGKDIRARLGDAMAEALWSAHKHMNESADFVMYWWDRAAEILTAKGSSLRRFGLVTTNSITQEFSRRVIKKRMDGKTPISLLMAIPDHPWTKATPDAAAVRIAMTVATAGKKPGLLRQTTHEQLLDTDQPDIAFKDALGIINPDLSIGADATSVFPLKANEGISSPGVKLHGSGFIVDPKEAQHLGLGTKPGLDKHIRSYRNGRDLTTRPRDVLVIDLFGMNAEQVRKQYPDVYQHLLVNVKPEREKQFKQSPTSDAKAYAELWWIFGKPRQELRAALEGRSRYIATVETAKHRTMQFLSADIIPDNMLVCVADEDAFSLGILSSRIHVTWALRAGGWLGVGNDPRYSKSKVFDPFPFPSLGKLLISQIRSVAEELDAFRKERQKEHPSLTLTQMYNVLEKLRDKTTLNDEENRIKKEGLILILKELHDKLDRLVFEAYTWPQTLTDEEIVAKLVALNHERAAEERRGHVRWLRPDYQAPRFGKDLDKQATKEEGAQITADLGLLEPAGRKPSFPSDAVGQTAAVFAMLASATTPKDAASIAGEFRKIKNLESMIASVLASLARLGHVSTKDGKSFEIRRAA